MKVTILGKSPSWQDAGGACSGYLVEDGGTSVVLDCGNGVFAKLRERIDYLDVDAVVLSHLHADHWLDLIPFAYALLYSPRQQPVPVAGYPGTEEPVRPRLIVPQGASESMRRVVGVWGNEDLIERAFEISEYEGGETVDIGSLRGSFHPVPHYLPTFAIEFTAEGSGRFTYGADSRPADELVEIARDTDLLVVEATVPRPERTGVRGHMTPAEAGDHARRAGARRVVITHLSDEYDAGLAQQQASEAFGGDVDVAREGAVYEL